MNSSATMMIPLNKLLIRCIETNNIDCAKLILETAEDITPNTTTAATAAEAPLIHAIKHKHFEITQLLLQHGADPNTRSTVDSPAYPALYYAIIACSPLNVKPTTPPTLPFDTLLLEHNADPNIACNINTGDSLLHLLCSCTLQHTMDNLVAHHADINITNKQHETPLHVAVKHDNVFFVMRLLADSNIDYTIKNNKGQTPLDVAITTHSNNTHTSRNKQIIEKLIEHYTAEDFTLDTIRSITTNAINNNRFDVLQLLLDRLKQLTPPQQQNQPVSAADVFCQYIHNKQFDEAQNIIDNYNNFID